MDEAGSNPLGFGDRAPLVAIPRLLPVTYRSSGTRAMIAMVLVGIAVAAYLVQIGLTTSQLGLLDAAVAGTLTDAEATASDARIVQIGLLAMLTYVVSAFGVLVWVWRAIGNVSILTARNLRWSRNEAVGWWFVPLANWVMPYRVIRDAFQALGSGASATVVTGWWLCHIGSTLLSWTVLAGSRTSSDTIDGLRGIVTVTSAMLAVEAAAGVLLILVIRRMEAFARVRERMDPVLGTTVPDWSRPTHDPGPIDPGAPRGWPVGRARGPALLAVDRAAEDRRTVESVVASPEGPLAPPPPPPPLA